MAPYALIKCNPYAFRTIGDRPSLIRDTNQQCQGTGTIMTATVEQQTDLAQHGAVAGLALAMLLASLGTSSANVALPALGTAFAAGFNHVQWVVLVYLLAITVAVVGAGRLGDRLGHQRVLLGGLALFTLASALCALAPTLNLLIAARLVQGLGAAVMIALTVAVMRETARPARIGSAMGLLGTMSAVGTALGPSLGGVLLAGPGWRGSLPSWPGWGWWPCRLAGAVCRASQRANRAGRCALICRARCC